MPSQRRLDACVVLDIDGVLADVRHRLHHLERRPKDWDAFFAAAKFDEVLHAGAEFARTAATTHVVVYLTGRPDRLRDDTDDWLRRHALPEGDLLMRSDGDRRPAAVMKLQMLRRLRAEYTVDLVVDDDPVVAQAAASAGFAVRIADWMQHAAPALHDAQERQGRT